MEYKGNDLSRPVPPHVKKIGLNTSSTVYTLQVDFSIGGTPLTYETTKSYSEINDMIKNYTEYNFYERLSASQMGFSGRHPRDRTRYRSAPERINEEIRSYATAVKPKMKQANIWSAKEKNCRNRAEKINEVIILLKTGILAVTQKTRNNEAKLAIVNDIMTHGGFKKLTGPVIDEKYLRGV